MSVNPERRCDDPLRQEVDWRGYVVRAGRHFRCMGDNPDPKEHREHVEPWLSALFQAEHLNVLVGSGLTTAIACAANVPAVDMNVAQFGCSQSDAVALAAQKNAKSVGREKPNIEDQLRTVIELIGGLRILASNSVGDSGNDDIRQAAADLLQQWKPALDNALSVFLKKVLATERGIGAALAGTSGQQQAVPVRRLLGGFLLPFASRAATRERAHIFTTNYDRLIEYGCDLLGLRVLDRFVGNLAPVFHSSRLGIDLHYTPPGIRGEPRNSVVVTYGYGFGDDHVNRVLRDMLSIPSTHLVIISFDDAAGRLPAFHDRAGNEAQMTLLVGPHFGDLKTLVDYYLPKAAIDRTTWRMIDLLNRRTRPGADGGQRENGEGLGSEGEG